MVLTMATDCGSVTADVTAVGNMMAGLMWAKGLAAAAAAKYGDCKGDGMYPGVACGKATYPEF
mgnify:FL=1